MKKHLLICSIFLLSFSLLFAQKEKFAFKLGEEYEMPRKSEDLSFFGNAKDGIVNLSLKKDELSVLRFDPKKLTLSSDQQIKLDNATRNMNSEDVVIFGTNYFWLRSDWDRKNLKEKLYCYKLDVKSGTVDEGTLLLESDKISGTYQANGYFSVKVTNKYSYNYDADHKKLLISYRLAPLERDDKKSYDRIGMIVMDENMKKVWESVFTMPYTEAIMDNSDFTVDVEGNAYMLAKVYATEKRKEKDKETGEAAYHYEVMKFAKGMSKPTTSSIVIRDNFIREAFVIANSKQEILVACTYSKFDKGNSIDGVFLSAVDKDGQSIKYKEGFYPFNTDEMAKYESARTKRKMQNGAELNNMKVRDVVMSDDGSILVTCERYYIVRRRYSSGNSSYTVTTYYFEDILAAHINTEGKMDWMRKIPKRQSGDDDYSTLGFKLISDSTGYYFLFLDNIRNQDLADDEKPKYHINGRGGQVLVTKIDAAGNTSNAIVFDTRDEDVMIFPREFTRINSNQFIGRAKIKKTVYQPLLITMK